MKDSVYLWEVNRVAPTFSFLPKIVEFLGYCPYDPDWTPGERLTWIRRFLGLSQEAMARRLRVDPGTLAKWERGGEGAKGGASSQDKERSPECAVRILHPR